jgi:hypothetical protein
MNVRPVGLCNGSSASAFQTSVYLLSGSATESRSESSSPLRTSRIPACTRHMIPEENLVRNHFGRMESDASLNYLKWQH